MLWNLVLKKNLLKFVLVGLVNNAQDLHKKRSYQRKLKHAAIQTNIYGLFGIQLFC